jgi:hypothetical protein
LHWLISRLQEILQSLLVLLQGCVRLSPTEIAAHHSQGKNAVFTGDRGSAIAAMTDAFERFVQTREDIGAMLGIGGSGGTALISPAMRALPIGVPKLMVSTMALGQRRGLCWPLGHRHDVFRYRHGWPEPDFAPRPG